MGAVASLAFTACNDNDGYSLSNAAVGLATVEKISSESSAYFLVLDSGTKLWPAATNFPYYRPDNGQRLMVNFTLLSDGNSEYDHDIKVNDLAKVLTKPMVELTAENADSIGSSPVVIQDIWVGADYINVIFDFKANNKRHMVNIVESADFGSTDELTKLQFRHNSYGDSEKYWNRGLASFNISQLKAEGKTAVNIELSAVDYKGEVKTYKLTYDWSGNAPRSTKTFPTNTNAVEVL